MLGSEITISILGFYFLQVALLPFQVWSWFSKKTDRKRLRFLLLTLAFIGFNSIALSSIGEQYGLAITFGIDLIALTSVYLFLFLEFNAFRVDHITPPLFIVLFVVDAVWIVVSKLDDSKLTFILDLIFSIHLEIIVIVTAIRLLVIANQKEQIKKTYFVASFVIASLIVLIPIMGLLGNTPAIKDLLVNLLYITLAFAYFRNHRKVKKIEQSRQFISRNNSEVVEHKESILLKISEKYGFTSKEHEIFIFVINGASNKEIANHFFIAEGTARKHISNIYSKVDGVNSRLELIEKVGLAERAQNDFLE